MTKISFYEDDGHFKVKALGHASGSPSVCAAISGIMYALAGYLQNSECDIQSMKLNAADAEIKFSGGESASAVYLMTVIGLMQIAKAHPEYAEIEEQKRQP